MGTPIQHPLVDAVTSRVVRVDGRGRVLRLSPPLADLLRRRRHRRRVVLVSSERSRLTVGLRSALVEAGAAWVVHDDRGDLRDGLTGRPYVDVDDAGTPVEEVGTEVVEFPEISQAIDTRIQLTVDLTILHRAAHDTSLGGAVELIAEAVSGSLPVSWGVTEPLLHPWDRWVMTQHARHAAPEPLRILAEGPHLSGTVTARVTEHGIEETVSVTVDVVDDVEGDSLDAGITRLTDALAEIARRSLPTFALVVAREGEADRCVCAVTYPPPNPVALLIGAPSVRRLGLELATLPTGDDAKVVGRPSLPAFVLPLGDARTAGWDALHQTLEAVGPERLATLVSSPLLQTWEEDLQEFDLLHQGDADGAETSPADHETPDGPDDPSTDDGEAKEGRDSAS
ncbi:DUF6177 family protein [Frigoribacterium sp. Leaf172]|uniref:DUF6177 family protein n=1 Tax=Frigoribacterium sp. Leaf172 TaxID=1736285 RepID=UPI0012E80562|nr:DUF6177 family protein [Frigoribacterium sp. Leaf172]